MSGTGRLNKDIYAKQSSKSGIAFHQGDVLYGKLRPYLQNWLLPTFDGLAVGDFWVLQPQNADGSFLYRLIQSRQFDEVANQSTGTKMPRADWKLVSKTVFSIPSNISEQAAIGTYFTALDSLITLHQRQPFLHSTPEISLTVQLIHPFYTSSWEQRKLGDVATFINGRAYSQPELLSSGKYKVLRVGNFYTNDSWYYSDLELGEKYYADYGDLLYTWSATFGPHIWLGDRVIYHYHIWKIDLSNQLEKQFAVQLLEQDKANILSSKNGSTMVHITKEGMEQKDVIIPPSTKEQQEIGAFFQQLDNLITLHQRKGKAAVTGCSNDANNSKGVYCKARDFGYKCYKEVKSQQIRCLIAVFIFCV